MAGGPQVPVSAEDYQMLQKRVEALELENAELHNWLGESEEVFGPTVDVHALLKQVRTLTSQLRFLSLGNERLSLENGRLNRDLMDFLCDAVVAISRGANSLHDCRNCDQFAT